MGDALALEYEGRGFSGSFDISAWLERAEGADVSALMDMRCGIPWEDAPHGLRDAYRELAGQDADTDPINMIFRDQSALLETLACEYPLLWESASGSALRCQDTTDMFGDRP